MQIIIEPVKINELQTLANISSKTFHDTFQEVNTKENMDLFLDQNFNLFTLQSEFTNPANHFFFAKIKNDIVGYVKLSETNAPAQVRNMNALEIARIYAVREKIGSGVGKAMLEFSIALAEKMKKQIIWLGVWEHNIRAINFYERFGFKKVGEHVFMLGEDAQTDWLMQKELKY